MSPDVRTSEGAGVRQPPRIVVKRPFVPLQSEAAECGVVAICAMTSLFGKGVSIEFLKEKYGSSNRGLSVSQLLTMLRESGFGAQAVMLDKANLKALKSPVIALWESRHFIVIAEINAATASVFDPEKGWYEEGVDTLATLCDGLGLEITTVPERVSVPLRSPIRLWPWLRRFRLGWTVYGVAAAAFGAQAFSALLPIAARNLVDMGVAHDAGANAVNQVLGFLLAGIVGIAVTSLAARLTAKVSGKLLVDLSDDVARRLLSKPIAFLSRSTPASLAGKVHTVQSIQSLLVRLVASTIITGVMALVAIIVIAVIYPGLAVAILGIRLVGLLADMPLMKELARASEARFRAAIEYSSQLSETIRAVAPLRAGMALGRSVNAVRRLNTVSAAAGVVVSERTQNRTDLGAAISVVDQAAYLSIGVLAMSAGEISLGTFVALGIYREYVRSGFWEIQNVLTDLVALRTASGRLEGIVDPAAPVPTFAEDKRGELLDGSIQLTNVSFRYSAFDPWVLSNFSLSIADGECVAIVGPSGCGKTTIANLCVGALTPVSGAVTIGGVQLNQQTESQILSNIATVMQDDRLITASILENITLRKNVPLDCVRRAAAVAELDGFIMSLPMRYETPISDDFAGLSGGQRQRILIARAVCANPRILIMDEATSSLDCDAEASISANIRGMKITRLIIAHRPETIATADRIVRIQRCGASVLEANSV